PRVELAWAMKAHQHAQVYFNVSLGAPRVWGGSWGGPRLTLHLPVQLISSVDPKFLNLTKVDDRIYEEFRKTFRDLRIDVLDPEELKSEPAKAKWRPFCLRFEGVVEDFNYGTLLRLDSRREYTEENTIFGG
ncbi:PBDC1 protein, partial [Menura novaehollandiae]|nr:PBDC1 protein [Menura novaehollandiae]